MAPAVPAKTLRVAVYGREGGRSGNSERLGPLLDPEMNEEGMGAGMTYSSASSTSPHSCRGEDLWVLLVAQGRRARGALWSPTWFQGQSAGGMLLAGGFGEVLLQNIDGVTGWCMLPVCVVPVAAVVDAVVATWLVSVMGQ